MKFVSLLTLLTTVFFIGCSEKKEKNTIKVGVIAGRESEVMETVSKIALEQYGLKVEVISFSDYATPNMALSDHSIDLNIFQHQPYLNVQNKDRGYSLVSVGNTFIFPLAGYSQKIKTISDLKNGATIALPNDPTNLARALILLQKQGLISLKENNNFKITSADILNNPKKLKFIELDAAQLPRSLEDVDLAIINTTYAAQINLLPTRDGLFVEEKDSPYVNIIVAREDNKNSKKVKDFVAAYQQEEVFQAANKLFQGNVIQGW